MAVAGSKGLAASGASPVEARGGADSFKGRDDALSVVADGDVSVAGAVSTAGAPSFVRAASVVEADSLAGALAVVVAALVDGAFVFAGAAIAREGERGAMPERMSE
jgi:hypothetical protein